jgi:hypothetical protein
MLAECQWLIVESPIFKDLLQSRSGAQPDTSAIFMANQVRNMLYSSVGLLRTCETVFRHSSTP